MSRVKKTVQALARIARNPWLLNTVLAADTDAWQQQALVHAARWGVAPVGLPVVSLRHFLPPNGADTLAPFAFQDGGSLPTDLALLRGLARQQPECRYFEIGTWRGESAANVAAVAATVHTLNLSAEEMRAMSLPEEYIGLHGFFSKDLANVTHLHGNSATFDFAGLNQKFDLVFIDGDHHYDAVRRDTARVFEHLVGPDTVVVWHDASRQPGVPRWEVVAGLLAGLPASAAGHLYQVSYSLCVLYSPQPLTATTHNPWADPQAGRVTIAIPGDIG
jgi:predicted O-methyltransferase YrrM